MSSVRYFVTEQDQAAKIGEMVQQRKSLKEKIATLEHELSQFSIEWSMMSRISDERNFSSDRYVFEGENLKVMHRSVRHDSREENYTVGQTISLKRFDREAIIRLLTDLSETRTELDRVMRQLAPFGIPS